MKGLYRAVVVSNFIKHGSAEQRDANSPLLPHL